LIRSTFLISFLQISICAIAIAQAAPNSAKSVAPSAGPIQSAPPAAAQIKSNVPANASVITINGVCDVALNGLPKAAPPPPAAAKDNAGATSSGSPSDCKTQITRAEFEKVMKIAPPGSNPRRSATIYAQLVTAANEGVKLGADKDPDFSEQLAFMRLQLLAQNAQRKIQAEASNVSDADVKAYYDKNSAAFEEVTLTRIFIPRNPTEASSSQPSAPESKTVAQPAPDPKAIADNARQQLASGGDPEKIQKTVYEQLKSTTQPPATKFGARRRGALPPAQEQKVFSLKAGEISDAIGDTAGYVIYKVDAKQQLSLDQVKDQIKQRLAQQRMADAQQKIMEASKADYNDSYFGAEASAPRPAAPSLKPKADSAPNASPATGANPSQTQSANPKK